MRVPGVPGAPWEAPQPLVVEALPKMHLEILLPKDIIIFHPG